MEDEADRSAIRQSMAAYNIAGDSGRIAEVVATFTADGELTTPLWEAKGAEALAAALSSGASLGERRPTFVRHNLTTCAITITGSETAAGRSYFLVLTDIGPDHAGVYMDRFRKLDGRWLIQRREVWIDWKADASFFEHQQIGRPQRRAERA